jgi:hypothetical protein
VSYSTDRQRLFAELVVGYERPVSHPRARQFRPTDPYPAGFYVLDGSSHPHRAGARVGAMHLDVVTECNICDDVD